jgi:hypothetical protein
MGLTELTLNVKPLLRQATVKAPRASPVSCERYFLIEGIC